MTSTGEAPPGVNNPMFHHRPGKAGALSTTAMIAAAVMTESGVMTAGAGPAAANADAPAPVIDGTARNTQSGGIIAASGEK